MSKLKLGLVMFILSFTFGSCKKEQVVKIPFEIITETVTEIDWTSAVSGGDVIMDGGTIVIEKGVVWDTKTNPTANLSTKTSDGRGLGSFKSKINGLVAGTQYFVRAYAINSTDTIYGKEVIFKTSSWTPKDINNVWDWWNTENGIIKEGDYVEYWVGDKGTKLEHGSDKGLLISSDKDFGNKPSILMNPNNRYKDCGYYTKSSSASSSKTVFLVAKVFEITTWNNIMINLGNGTIGVWGNSNGTYFLHHFGYPHINTGTKFVKNTYQFIRFSYNKTNGGTSYYIDNNVSFRSKLYAFDSKPGLDYSNKKLGVGYYDSKYGQTPKMSVVEVLVMDGIPTEDEVVMYEKYLKYKYKF
jgi:hypothetical protein